MPSSARFQLALRVWHPTEEPGVLTAAFGRRPTTTWANDTARTAADGSPLPGVHDETYWVAEVASGAIAELIPAMRTLLADLGDRRDELERLTDGAGRVECFVGWFEDGNSGVVLDPALLANLTDLGVALAFDVYGAAGR